MASIQFEEVFEEFLGSIEDIKLLSLEKDDAYKIMSELLRKSLYTSYVYRLFSYAKLDILTQSINYEMSYVIDDEADKRFVITALSKWMKYEWLSPQLNSVTNTAQFFGGKEAKYYAQSSHLTAIKEMTTLAYTEARNFIKDRSSFSNNYLDGKIKK